MCQINTMAKKKQQHSIKRLTKISPLRDIMEDKPSLDKFKKFFSDGPDSGTGLTKGQITEMMCIIQKESAETLAILQEYKDKAQ